MVLVLLLAGCERTVKPEAQQMDMKTWFADRGIAIDSDPPPEQAAKPADEARLLGDVTGNGTVSLWDLRALWECLISGDSPHWYDMDLLDIDRDGDTDWTDLKLMGEYLSNPEAGNLHGIGLSVERLFDIDLIFVGEGFSQSHRDLLNEAAATWESVITADVSDVSDWEFNTNDLEWWAGSNGERIFGHIVDSKNIDDVRVYVGMDNLEDLHGYARSLWTRWSDIPFNGYVVLSQDMLAKESDQYIIRVMIHELGHVLGFGIPSWDTLLENHSPDQDLDTYFPGVLAHQAFDEAGGRWYRQNGVPVQNTGNGRASHWRQSTLGAEIMTPSRADGPLSAITIQALADLGYEVDPSRAEPYQVPPQGSAKVVVAEPRWRCGVGLPEDELRR